MLKLGKINFGFKLFLRSEKPRQDAGSHGPGFDSYYRLPFGNLGGISCISGKMKKMVKTQRRQRRRPEEYE